MTNKRKLLFILVTLMIFSTMMLQTYAEGYTSISISGNNVTIKGAGASTAENITLQVFTKDNTTRAYIDQKKADENGNFVFTFYLDNNNYRAVAVSTTKKYEAEFTVGQSTPGNGGSSGGSSGSSNSSGSTAKLPVTQGLIPVLDKATGRLQVKTDICTISMSPDIKEKSGIDKNKTIAFTITKVDVKTLSESLQKEIGNRPVLDINFLVDGKVTPWKNEDSPIEISIKYIPTAEELKDPEHMVIWYIDSMGKIIAVPNGRYDAKTGMVTFKTDHLSRFAIAYSKRSFEDINKYPWAQKQIEVMASKGVLKGKTDKAFSPSEAITRGEYVSWMIKALGLNAKVDSNFEDVKLTDENYKEIAIAKKLGIATGTGDNKFKPNDTITRQDIMVLTERALKIMKKLGVEANQLELSRFNDANQIASYAKNSVANMVKEQILNGSENKINPKGTTTRVEAAVIVYRLYNK